MFLGHKKDQPDKLYAIKVMKKSETVNKNMVNQGMYFSLSLILVLYM